MQSEESERKRKRLRRASFWLGGGLLIFAALRSIDVTQTDRAGPVDQAANGSVTRTIRVKAVDVQPADPNRAKVEREKIEALAKEGADRPEVGRTSRDLMQNHYL